MLSMGQIRNLSAKELKTALIIAKRKSSRGDQREKALKTLVLREYKRRGIKP